MQQELFINQVDYSGKKVLIGLSGGINSMAVLCWLAQYPEEFKPAELHLFYAHFIEHSPDTEEFVLAGVEYAKKHFQTVVYEQTNNSVIEFFREKKMIPHPTIAPCTKILKIIPMAEYAQRTGCEVDLVGYVKGERRRVHNMALKTKSESIHDVMANGLSKQFPIADKENEWCFEVAKRELGWYPAIYDLKDKKGNRLFTHNNCLPCKNMQMKDFEKVKTHYPEHWDRAMELAEELEKHWGRSKTDFEDNFMTSFGREDWQVGFSVQPCQTCAFD